MHMLSSATLPKSLLFWLLWAAPALVLADKDKKDEEKRPVLGWVEYVKVVDADMTFKARIDTGAGLASINAQVKEVRKSGDGKSETVVFSIHDDKGNKKTLERPLVKWINIKKKSESGYIRRPVVRLDFCVGGKRVEARVNLADREDFLYPLLIGRNVLKAGDYMVDPQETFNQEPDCK